LIVAFDASVLVYFFDEKAKAPLDEVTGQPVTDCKARIDFLIAALQRNKAKIIIPTPALGEVFVKAGNAAPQWLQLLHKSRHFRVASFDERAALEFAATQAERRVTGNKAPATTRAKAKFDDQIVSIAAVEGASKIYSDDPHIKKLAGRRFEVIGIGDLPLPPESAQGSLQLDPMPPADETGSESDQNEE
jgi:hypothetical protein